MTMAAGLKTGLAGNECLLFNKLLDNDVQCLLEFTHTHTDYGIMNNATRLKL